MLDAMQVVAEIKVGASFLFRLKVRTLFFYYDFPYDFICYIQADWKLSFQHCTGCP